MTTMRVVGYVRVSAGERRSTRPSRTTQRRAVEEACASRGWQLVGIEEDARSGRSLRRPGLQAALTACGQRRADGIVVMQLDRLTTSLPDLADLMHQALDGRFTILAPDLDVDLGTERGVHLATVLAVAAGWHGRGAGRGPVAAPEHRRRTDRRGRPSSTPPALVDRIRRLRTGGATLQSICDQLNAEGVATPRGGSHWRPTSLRAIVRAEAVSR